MMADRLAADIQILEHGQIGEDAPVLRHETKPPARDLEWLEMGDVLAQEAHGAAALRDQGHQGFEGRRFAGAVAAHERDHFAAADLERRLEQNLRSAVPRREPLHLEHGRAHARPWACGANVRPVPR